MLTLKNRIQDLKNTTKNSDVVDILNIANEACKKSEPLNTLISETLIKDLEKYSDDDSVKSFILREERLIAINKLGIKELVEKISESELMQNQTIKYFIESFKPLLNHNPEYLLINRFLEKVNNISWHKDVKEGVEQIKDNFNKYSDDINLCTFIGEFSKSSGEYLVKSFINEFDEYFTKRDELSKKRLVEKIKSYLHEPMLKTLNEYLISTMDGLQAADNSVADVKNIHSPVLIKENVEIFFSSGKFIKKSENGLETLKESEVLELSDSFKSLAFFLNSPGVKLEENKVTIYTSNKKVNITKTNEKLELLLNDKPIEFAAFTKFFMNEGIFRQNDNNILNNIVNLYENFDNIYEIDYGKKIKSKVYETQWVDVFKIDEKVYVIKNDGANKKLEFYKDLNALQTRNLVFEHIGYDMSKSFKDLLPEEQKKVDFYNKEISDINESVDYLNSKKIEIQNKMNEDAILRSDKRISDVIEAVDEEIQKLKEKQLVLKNALKNYETIEMGFSPDEYVKETAEIDEFWSKPANKDKTLYFAQTDHDKKRTWLVGSQTFEQFKDDFRWEVEGTDLNKDAAVAMAKRLSKEDKKGFYIETGDVVHGADESFIEAKDMEIGESKKYKKELLNISAETKSMSKEEFTDYIKDYTTNPKEYDIDLDSEYGKALLWAKDNIDKAFKLIKEAKETEDPDGNEKFSKKEKSEDPPSPENELGVGDEIKMKNDKKGSVIAINEPDKSIIVKMEDGATVSVPKDKTSELEILSKKSKEEEPEVKVEDGGEGIKVIEGKSDEWIDGYVVKGPNKGKDILVYALDYTEGGPDDFIKVKDEKGKELKVKKENIKVDM